MTEKNTAYHEAGHVVAAYRLGFDIGSVTIEPTEDTLGRSFGEGPNQDGTKVAEHIMALYAGAAAERILEPGATPEGCEYDNEQADEFLNIYANLNELTLRRKADELLRSHWAEVEALAIALLEAKKLTAYEAEIVIDAVEAGASWRDWLQELRVRAAPKCK